MTTYRWTAVRGVRAAGVPAKILGCYVLQGLGVEIIGSRAEHAVSSVVNKKQQQRTWGRRVIERYQRYPGLGTRNAAQPTLTAGADSFYCSLIGISLCFPDERAYTLGSVHVLDDQWLSAGERSCQTSCRRG
jgi:hypothetical protein